MFGVPYVYTQSRILKVSGGISDVVVVVVERGAWA